MSAPIFDAISDTSIDSTSDMPFSCIVTPYRRSAAYIVPRRCVMSTNCVFSQYFLT